MAGVVMAIGPHPDDLEIGMGGTLVALVRVGIRVVLVDLTDGEPTPHGSPEIRRREAGEATKLLGVKDRVTLDIPNREIFDTVPNRKRVAELIRCYKPRVLFIPYWEDAHPDHTNASRLCEAARFYGKLVKSDIAHEPHYPRRVFYYFSTHLRPRFSPSFVFDISSYIELKIKAIEAYRSQFVDNTRNITVFERIRAENSYWGFQVGVAYAEPFVCRESIRVSEANALLEL